MAPRAYGKELCLSLLKLGTAHGVAPAPKVFAKTIEANGGKVLGDACVTSTYDALRPGKTGRRVILSRVSKVV